ncbi:MAG: hypothetical protein HQM16_03200 [Deltaproteobacteria bacterium]|nr:hypothetical protein [Deltaproteobacteria bacterium]
MIIVEPRNNIMISDGTNACEWDVESLEGLFRSDVQPPDLREYPAEYTCCFFIIEKHMVTLSDIIGDQTDEDFENVYSCLARRPDARTGGVLTDIVWQCAALMLALELTGKPEIPEAVFEELRGVGRSNDAKSHLSHRLWDKCRGGIRWCFAFW